MRRFVTFLLVAAATAAGTLWWLHDGDLEDAVRPVLPRSGAPADDGVSGHP